MADLRVAVVANPSASARAGLRARALERLRARARVVAEIETRADGRDVRRIAELARGEEPDVLVAAGGDGTAALAASALLETGSATRPALAFLPLGTGNNAARSFGLRSLRRDRERAIALAVDAVAHGERREMDLGVVDGRPFLGSFAVGLDAAILARRNRMQRRLGAIGLRTGYGLYLWSVALTLAERRPLASARRILDGVEVRGPLSCLVATNAPVYAGPLRFDAENDAADGRLDVHEVASAWEYLSEYPRAWQRYLRALRGGAVSPSPRLRRARALELELDRPLPAQADGEELGAAASYRLSVLPRAIRVCLPPPPRLVTTRAGSDRSR